MNQAKNDRHSRVGMIGAGQLARMTYQAGIPLGLSLRVLAANPDDGAALVAADIDLGSPDSLADLQAFAERCGVVTFDHELVEPVAVAALEAAGHTVRPPLQALRAAQDKGLQRALFDGWDLPLPVHERVMETGQIERFAARHGWPVVAKACRGGYDGRGVWVLESPEAAERLYAETTGVGIDLLVEEHVAIDRELAVLVARRPGGEAALYPVVETVQVGGICHEIRAPAPVAPDLAEAARRLAVRIADGLDVSGILAVELFETGGRLLINEIAVRPHNSGHYSIEGCVTSQFENHLRAVLDWPLGRTDLTAPAVVTVNVLGTPTTGDLLGNLPAALEVPGVHVHLYGKDARPGRKLGHVTALGDDTAEVRERAWRAADRLSKGTEANRDG